MATRPTDFPGLVIDPTRQCVVNQVEVARFPVRVCECFSECTNPGAPLPLIVECFIYGEELGWLDRGCPIITDGALGVTLGTLEAHFFARLQVDPDVDLLAAGEPLDHTALRFNLYLGKPVATYEVYLIDDTGNRAYVSFAPSVDAVLWVNIPLDDFTELDGPFNWNAVRYFYFGFVHNYQPASCMMAIDNLRVCANADDAVLGPFSFGVDTPPYGGNDPSDVCTMIEDFDTLDVLSRVECDADAPGPPSPDVCDECVIGPPLTNGNQAVHFCVQDPPDPPDDWPPSIRYAPVAPFALTTDVTFTVYSWRPGVNCRVILLDEDGYRAIYDFVAVGGSQTLTVALASFSLPDSGVCNFGAIAEWWMIFGLVSFNDTDRFGVDELYTNGGVTLINDMSTLTDIYCGYDEEPPPIGGILFCEFTERTSAFDGVSTVKFDSLTWEGPLSVGTVSQLCTDLAGYWDLGFDNASDPTADVQFAFDFPVVPDNTWAREIFLKLYDEAGRELMIEVSPPSAPFSIGPNVYTVNLNTGIVAQPTSGSRDAFDPRRVTYWEMAFVGFTDAGPYPLEIHFEGFRFRVATVVTKDFLFDSYADRNDFEANGGKSCLQDWRLVYITAPGTTHKFLCGGGMTVNTDPTFPPQNVGLDRGRSSIDLPGQNMRCEIFLNPPLGDVAGYDFFNLYYRARPDPGAPATMHFIVQEFDGATSSYSFPNGSGVLDVNGVRFLQIPWGAMSHPIGGGGQWIKVMRLVKDGIADQPRSGTEGTGADIFSGDEVDLVRVEAQISGGGPLAWFNGKASSTTVRSARGQDAVYSRGIMGGDDQPPTFDAHVHHQTISDNPTVGPFPIVEWPYYPDNGDAPITGFLLVDKLVEGPTGRISFLLDGGPWDLTVYPQSIWVWAVGEAFGQPVVLMNMRGVRMILHDGSGGYLDFPMVNRQRAFLPNPVNYWGANDLWYGHEFDMTLGTPGPTWDPTDVVSAEIIITDGWYIGRWWIGRVDIGTYFAPRTILVNWSRSKWNLLLGISNPANQFSVGKAIDPNQTPVVALNCDKTKTIAYWGMDDAWLLAADIVLVPSKYRDDPIVGLDGNRGYNPDGTPIPGVMEALARDTGAWYGNVAFKMAPFAGCRNIWMDLVYLDAIICLGTDLEKTLYEFWDAECGCILPELALYVSNFSTNERLDRILPDDGFILEIGARPLPSGYPEAIQFEYCSIPDLDQYVEDDTDPDFRISRETPTCTRPDDPINTLYGHYVVRITIEAKTGPISVAWTDILPGGETVVSGASSGVANLVNPGDTAVFEYMVRTAQLHGGTISITGSAVKAPNPAVLLNSTPIDVDTDCDTLGWNSFGSQNSNVYGTVFWAGGGRADPVVPPGVNLWTKVWAGPGSAGLSKREQYLFSDTTVPASAASHIFQMGGTGIEGFAIGIPVWVFNTDFVDNPARKITGLDIEAQEASATPDREITGLYGYVTNIDGGLMQIEVTFYDPPPLAVRYTMLARACIMVAPRDSRGYYWEASPGLVDVCDLMDYGDGSPLTEMRWGFRYWNSTKYPAQGTEGAGYICDGDGESTVFEMHGDMVKEIINPVDWMDLLCSPVLETKLSNNALPTQDDIRVCDYCLFEPCDIIQVVDENCSGREGDGPGQVSAVVSTLPDDPSRTCDDYYAAEGHVRIIPPILSAIVGCGAVDGYLTTRRARAFVKPDVARYAYSPTTKVYGDGTPVDGSEFVGVDFENGIFTFAHDVVVNNPCACFRALNSSIQLDTGQPGIYFLKGIDKSGCKSPPSKPIKIVGVPVVPPDCGVGESPILLWHKQVEGGESVYETPYPGADLVTGTNGPATFVFQLAYDSRVEFRASIFGWDVLYGSIGGLDSAGWTEMWVKNEASGIFYPMADRLTFGTESGTDAIGTDSGAGAVMSRVVDLPAGNYTFNLYVRNGNTVPPSKSRVRFPVDVQVWLFGRCNPSP